MGPEVGADHVGLEAQANLWGGGRRERRREGGWRGSARLPEGVCGGGKGCGRGGGRHSRGSRGGLGGRVAVRRLSMRPKPAEKKEGAASPIRRNNPLGAGHRTRTPSEESLSLLRAERALPVFAPSGATPLVGEDGRGPLRPSTQLGSSEPTRGRRNA